MKTLQNMMFEKLKMTLNVYAFFSVFAINHIVIMAKEMYFDFFLYKFNMIIYAYFELFF